MCSSSKASQDLRVKKIPTSALKNEQLSDFVAIANAADARREAKEQAELEALKQSERLVLADQQYAFDLQPDKRGNFLSKLRTACHF